MTLFRLVTKDLRTHFITVSIVPENQRLKPDNLMKLSSALRQSRAGSSFDRNRNTIGAYWPEGKRNGLHVDADREGTPSSSGTLRL